MNPKRIPASITAAALTFLSLAAARADIVIVQETDNALTGKTRTTMSIKGPKVRTDAGTETSVIMDTETGDMTTLMHEQKMIVAMNTKDLAAAAAATPGAAETPKSPQLVKTGESEKIGEYQCDIYTMEAMGTKSKMWIARDYPGYAKFKAEIAVLGKLAGPGAKFPEMPGMAVKTETEAGGVKYTTTLVSLKESKVDEKVFAIPTGYKSPGQ